MYKNRGWRGGIVKTTSVCSIVPRMAEKLGLTVYTVAVGFKNVCEIMLKEDILIGGEESNDLGFKNRIDLPYEKPDRMDLIPELQLRPPGQIGNLSVEEVTTYRGVEAVNGIKFHFTDKISWLLIRASETEPLVRIYSESTSDEMVQRLLNQGLKLLKTVT